MVEVKHTVPQAHVPVPPLWAECAYCKEAGEEECLHPVGELRWNGEQWCCEECGSGEEPDLWDTAPQIVISAPVSISASPPTREEGGREDV